MAEGPSTCSTSSTNQDNIEIMKICVDKSIINHFVKYKQSHHNLNKTYFKNLLQKMYLDPCSTIQTRIGHP